MCRRPYHSTTTSSFILPVYVNTIKESSKQRVFPLLTTFFLSLLVVLPIGFIIAISGKMSTPGITKELLRPIVFCGPSGAGKGRLRGVVSPRSAGGKVVDVLFSMLVSRY